MDSGGTFTDAVGPDGTTTKVLSTPDDPGLAVRAAAAAVSGGASIGTLAHGTTVATNSVLEGTLATVALFTTVGFADVIEIARQNRPRLFDHFADRPPPLVPSDLRLEVDERVGPDGAILRAVDPAALPEVPEGVGAVAVCFLHADLQHANEAAAAEALRARGLDVCASHEVAPEMREYERLVTTVLNAGLRPRCRTYVQSLEGAAERVFVMTSAGGLLPAAAAGDLPAALLLSGPAGGVAAAAHVAAANGYPDAVTFDMGGTSTDVCLVQDGRPEPAAQREVAGYPVRLPSLDIHTVGAGGGSIAWIDGGGALRVGPHSAGADPGPACYGRGGADPTVTDANLVAGRIPADATFGDLGPLDPRAASAALETLGVSATDVIAVVNAEMEQAVRAVTVERGVDPRGLALVAFGGAGPLHACELAELLGMTTVIVPAAAGVLSAIGLSTARLEWDLVRSWSGATVLDGLEEASVRLGAEATAELAGMLDIEESVIEVEMSVDCRYEGQGFELRVPAVAEFAAEHQRRNGYDRPGVPVEVVAVRARAWVGGELSWPAVPPRAAVDGPAVVADTDCSIHVPAGWRGRVGALGALVLERRP